MTTYCATAQYSAISMNQANPNHCTVYYTSNLSLLYVHTVYMCQYVFLFLSAKFDSQQINACLVNDTSHIHLVVQGLDADL